MQVKSNMGHDYSYSQPSESEDLFCNSVSSGFSETDDLIRRDQAEISLQAHSSVQYPPQPEVEFGFPKFATVVVHRRWLHHTQGLIQGGDTIPARMWMMENAMCISGGTSQ